MFQGGHSPDRILGALVEKKVFKKSVRFRFQSARLKVTATDLWEIRVQGELLDLAVPVGFVATYRYDGSDWLLAHGLDLPGRKRRRFDRQLRAVLHQEVPAEVLVQAGAEASARRTQGAVDQAMKAASKLEKAFADLYEDDADEILARHGWKRS